MRQGRHQFVKGLETKGHLLERSMSGAAGALTQVEPPVNTEAEGHSMHMG